MSSTEPALKLWRLIQSHRVTAVIYVAARLGLAELLRDGSRSLAELAQATGANKPALGRLLTALSTIGVCTVVAEQRYALAETGIALDSAAEPSFKASAIFEGQMLSQSWTGLLETIMTGKTSSQLKGVQDTFELMARTPENIDIFNAAMVDFTRFVTPDILRAYDFGGIAHLMDVGGGSGELIGAVTRTYSHIRGTVFDLPRCADSAMSFFARMGVGGRAAFQSGDFFDTVPLGADAIIMKSIIHDWNDEQALTILTNCRKALPANGTLLLVERLMPEFPGNSEEDREQALTDLVMLRGPGGLERTKKQYDRLLGEAGLGKPVIYPAGLFSVLASPMA